MAQFDLDDDTVAGLAAGNYAPDTVRPLRTGSVSVNKAVIAIVAGALFLMTALAAVILSLVCLYSGVFSQVEATKAIAGFAGGVIIALITGNLGWRFVSRA